MAAPVLGVEASSLGPVLVDPGGRAVYVFTADRPGQPACTGACLATWPAVPATTMPLDPPGATAQLGVFVRPDGTRQLTVDGSPAYTFTGDTTAGTTAGQGDRLDGGTFELLTPTGSPIAPPAPPPSPPVPIHPSTVVPRRTLPAPPPVVSRPPAPMPISQGNGGDHDGDNRGGPNDGDGGV